MPRYHFSSVDGSRDIDREGVELPDRHAAQVYATRYVGELLQSEPDELWQGGQWLVEVTDDDGVLLFTVVTRGDDAPEGPVAS